MFWTRNLSEKLDDMTISDIKDMHRIVLHLKHIMTTLPNEQEDLLDIDDKPNAITAQNDLFDSNKKNEDDLLFVFQHADNNAQNSKPKSDLEELEGIF